MTPFRMLDPVQRKAIDLCCADGNCLVLGEAGTGKSVVLAHAVSQYKVRHPDASVCVLSYTNALVALLEHDLDGRGVPVMTIHECMNRCRRRDLRYDCVFVDEVQDMDPAWAKVLKKHADRFVLVGDYGQQIYKDLHDVMEERELVRTFGVAADHKISLGTDYRLPKNCRRLVQAIFLERRLDAKLYRTMANAEVTLFHGKDWDDEISFAIEKAKATARPGSPSAVLFEVNRAGVFRFLHAVDPSFDNEKIDPEVVNEKLRDHDVPFRFLGKGFGNLKESDERAITYVMTWHSAKGLDFETIIVPNVGASKCRANPFYVALTRARRNLVLTYTQTNDQVEKVLPCDFVRRLSRNVSGRIEPETVTRVQPSLFDGIF